MDLFFSQVESKLLTFMVLISFVRPRRRQLSRQRCCLSKPAPDHIVVGD